MTSRQPTAQLDRSFAPWPNRDLENAFESGHEGDAGPRLAVRDTQQGGVIDAKELRQGSQSASIRLVDDDHGDLSRDLRDEVVARPVWPPRRELCGALSWGADHGTKRTATGSKR